MKLSYDNRRTRSLNTVGGAEEVERKYLTVFPEMTGKYEVFICESADGVDLSHGC